METVENLVFEGGGAAGIAYGGALLEMEKLGKLENIKRVGGTSAGAITACLLAVGYSPQGIIDVISKTDFASFEDDAFGVVRDVYGLLSEFGWNKGDKFKEWLGNLIKRKCDDSEITFSELKTGVRLSVVVTNLTKQRADIYSIDTTPSMSIVDAVRASMSIPLFFRCVRYNGDIIVDGGVAHNYPINLFDRYEGETIGFRLDTTDEINREPHIFEINSFSEYTTALVNYLLEAANNRHLSAENKARTIFIDRAGVAAVDFDVSERKIKQLIQNGAEAVRRYFIDFVLKVKP
jgi:NTE family protein